MAYWKIIFGYSEIIDTCDSIILSVSLEPYMYLEYLGGIIYFIDYLNTAIHDNLK